MRDGQTHPTQVPLGHAVLARVLLPRRPTVVRDVETAPFATRLEEPRPAPVLPHGGKELVWVRRIHHEVGRTGALVREQHAFPGVPAVGRLEDTALVAVAPGGSHHAEVCDVGVRGIEDYAVNAFRALESQVGPRLPAVHRLVHAVAHAGAVPRVTLAGAHPHDVGVRLIDRDGADRSRPLIVEDRLPRDTAVHRFPQATRGCTHIDDVGIAHHRVHGRHASAHTGGPDTARLHGRKPCGVHLRLGDRVRGHGYRDAEQKRSHDVPPGNYRDGRRRSKSIKDGRRRPPVADF